MISRQLSCGCVNAQHPTWDVTYCVTKCDWHKEWLRSHPSHGEEYYRNLGVLGAQGEVQSARYIEEFKEALGELPPAAGFKAALEVGCGVSPYVPMIQAAGYEYQGVELDVWAARRTAELYGVKVASTPFEQFVFAPGSFGLVLSAHCLEHFTNAPSMLLKIRTMLCPLGRLILIVPDDTDQTNPDHLWFFSDASLYRLVSTVGFRVERVAIRRRVQTENFIYLSAIRED